MSEMPVDESATRSLPLQAAVLYLGLLVPLLMSVPFTVLVARGLGPAAKGEFAVMLQVFFLVELLLSLGIDSYFVIHLSSGAPLSKVWAVANSHVVAVALALTPVLLVVFSLGVLPPSMDGIGSLALIWCGVVLLVAGRHMLHIVIGRGKPQIFLWAGLAQTGTQAVGIVWLFLAGNVTLLTVSGAYIAGVAVRFLLPFVYVVRSLRPRWDLDHGFVRCSLRYGWRRCLSDVEDALNTRLPVVLMPFFGPLREVGLYSVAMGIVEILGQAGMAVAMAALRRPGDGSVSLVRPARAALWLCGAVAVLGIPAALTVPVIFGHEYRGAVQLVLVLLPTVPLLALNRSLTAALSSCGEVSTLARIAAMGLVTIAVACVVLGGAFGPHGLSVGLTIGLGLQSILLGRRLLAVEGASWSTLFVPSPDDLERVRRAGGSLLRRIARRVAAPRKVT